MSTVTDKALEKVVAKGRQTKWLKENAAAFSAQAAWHQNNDHPLADIMLGLASETWTR